MKKKNKVITFLGQDTEFEGRLNFRGTIRIDGHFRGEIRSGGNLIVGEDGIIEANMHVEHMVVKGEVHGNIIAEKRVDVLSPGKVFGNIEAPSVVIDEGVIFEGKTRMYRARDNDKSVSLGGQEALEQEPPPRITAIYGIVRDQETGDPIRNAEVVCKGANELKTKTNASGYYEQINLREGKWSLVVRAKGYKKAKTKVLITGKGTHEQNFQLAPK
ncbi:MAG: polymer-forming cytoskeletal protein [Deltaproteobacteria bacterium]|nr:polymer-forming cytoskeletal protein [Deltaproteobacteria bacterium]MBW2136835.1 polymer-forming cytoskeletal protein [Deltaproteobacteria bacterium]